MSTANIEITDSHTHLDAKEFDSDRAEVIERAVSAGVTRIVTIGASNGFFSAQNAISLAEQHSSVWASVGIHPHDAATPLDTDQLSKLASHPKVVAIGETGLDFFRDWSPHDLQEMWFRAQVELALGLKKPLIIHSRDAGDACLKILKELNAKDVGGVFHCYAEDAAFAKTLAEINFLVSFPGTLTFKKNNALRSIAKEIPLSQIMVETDAPYMAPEPHRGKRCESSFVVDTLKILAQVKEITLEEAAVATTENAKKLFKIG